MFEDKIVADLSSSTGESSEMNEKESVPQSDSREKVALELQSSLNLDSAVKAELKNQLSGDCMEVCTELLAADCPDQTCLKEVPSLKEESPTDSNIGSGDKTSSDAEAEAGHGLENDSSEDFKDADFVGSPTNCFFGKWEGFSAIPEWKPAPKRRPERGALNLAVLSGILPGTVSDEEALQRNWEDLSGIHPPVLGQEGSGRFEFTVMCYNILSQNLLEMNKTLYAHCQPEFLNWEYRLKSILEEVKRWDPDVLCLQEVQEDHYREQLESVLIVSGYECIYKRRTGIKTDGCAICYKSAKFSLISCVPIEFFRPPADILNRDNVGLITLLQPLTPETAEAENVRTSKVTPVCIVNTHLLYNPRRGDIKLAQTAVLLAEIDRIARINPEEEIYYPIILCGDLNAVPDSPLYAFIRNGKLQYRGLFGWKVSGQEDFSHEPFQRRLEVPLLPNFLGITGSCQFTALCQKKKTARQRYGREFLLQFRYCEPALKRPEDLILIPGVTDLKPEPPTDCPQTGLKIIQPDQDPLLSWSATIKHCLNLTSAYSHFLPKKVRPEVSTLPMGYGVTVDYIFYSAEPIGRGQRGGRRQYRDGPLKLLGRLPLLSQEDLWAANGLPNRLCSSDHLSLVVKFGLDPVVS
ncbi:protein angel homolog 1 [Protopterus annectens]|uniref:protein angel homolog 1 n=1 Tax=Protopterus annectens TaxID=7888 RepID=UPI001CF992F9|nr:protein angel homolog 1 [Protopterus annectens]